MYQFQSNSMACESDGCVYLMDACQVPSCMNYKITREVILLKEEVWKATPYLLDKCFNCEIDIVGKNT